MKRRVWSVEEIEGILLAAGQANSMATAVLPEQEGEAVAHYCQGFTAALVTMALAFGLSPRQVMRPGPHSAESAIARRFTDPGGAR